MEEQTTITITYPENVDMEAVTTAEEEFATYLETMGVNVSFHTKGILPRPRRPKKDE